MLRGIVASATRAFSKQSAGGVLPLTSDTFQQLSEKHLHPSHLEGLRLEGRYKPPNPVIYERVTGEIILKKALQTHGYLFDIYLLIIQVEFFQVLILSLQ